jgi:atypical dual specificity phosphatase
MSIEVLRLVKVKARLEPAFREQLLRSPLQFLQEFDLTEEEKQQVILPNFNWLFENKLAAMAYPESEDAFTVLFQLGIRALLNLSEVTYPFEAPNIIGMLNRHIPVADYGAPTLQQVQEAVAMISSCLDRDMPVVVHCLAGLGRTGTILACYLVKTGMSANDSIITIREWRSGSIETSDQEAVVYEYERFINKQV